MIATIVALALLCGALVTVTAFRGPRLDDVRIDAAALTEQAGGLRLFANERVAEVTAEQVRVTPDAEYTVSTTDDVIAVQFDTPLDYATEYSVTVTGVTSVYADRESTFEYEFTTEDASLLHLDRADPVAEVGQPDRIVRTNLKGGAASVLYSTSRIQTFTTVGSALAVVTTEEDGTGSVSVIDADEPEKREQLLMPARGIVTGIAGGDPAGYLVFAMDAVEGETDRNLLYSVDLTGDHLAHPVLGLTGEPIDAPEWVMLPGGDRMAVRSAGGSLLLVDLTGAAPPTPLGEYASLSSVSLGGTTLAVGDLYGVIALSLEDGTEQRLQNTPVGGAVPYGGDLRLLSDTPVQGGGGDVVYLPRVQQIASYNPSTARFDSSIVADDGLASRVLYASPDQQDSIEGFSVSPNGLYVAVTVTPDFGSSSPDGHPSDPRATSVSTYIIDIRTGERVGLLSGFDVGW